MTKSERMILALAALVLPVSANAVVMAFTDQSAFLAALPGTANTLDFDSQAAGTVIADGDSVDGITFNYDLFDLFGVSLVVTDGAQFGGGSFGGPFLTTSGSNFLGTDDADLLQAGDGFTLDFAPVNAIGMSFITADPIFDGDITLSAGGGSVSLVAAEVGADLGDGGLPFFLGLIDTENTFGSASIDTLDCGGCFIYNVDDIITSVVPVPGAIWLFLPALAGLAAASKKKR